MKDILVKRLFWVVIGLVFIGLLGFYFFKIRSLAAANAAIRDALDQKMTKMRKFASKSDIKNSKWILYAEDLKKRVEETTQQCEEFFAQNLKAINTRFLTDPEDPGSGPIRDRAHWKERYNQERAGLSEKLRKAGIQVSRDAFDFRDWGERVPTTEDIDGERTEEGIIQPGAQKEFWLQAYLVDAMVNVTPRGIEEAADTSKPETGRRKAKDMVQSRVLRLVKIQIQRPQPPEGVALEGAIGEVAAKIPQYQLVENTYLVIPFILTVDMDWRFAPLLIRNLLTSPWPFYVTTVDATRLPRAEAEKLAGGTGVSSLVRLTLHCVALDFTPMRTRLTVTPKIEKPAKKRGG